MTKTQNTINVAATTTAQQFAINPPVANTAGPNIMDIGGSVSIGSYAGLFTAPTNGMIVSGTVGIGTATPGYPLDVNGSISALRVYTTATLGSGQLITLAEGIDQGGLGGGVVGVLKTMSAKTTIVFDTQANVSSSSSGFQGGVFDGRYIYLVPNNNGSDVGLITRYDTTVSFSASTSYSLFSSATLLNSNSRGFVGGFYDGRYVYLIPNSTSSSFGQLTRYDTTADFTISTSYSVFNTAANVNSNSYGFSGGIFDGRYLYLVPNQGGASGQVTRFDTAGTFSSTTYYSVYDLAANVNSNSRGFVGGTFDGRYVYFSPSNDGGDWGLITRYDTSLSFSASTSYAVFDLAANVNSNSRGFFGSVFDGRYIYFVPHGVSSSFGLITRLDTTGSFTTSTSYAVFDTAANVNSLSFGFDGGVFDGRYVYFVPNGNNSSGLITRYDTTAYFVSSTSYSVFNTEASVNSLSLGFTGGIFDGRYVYFVPNLHGQVTRIDGYPGFAASAIATLQAPNGLVVGSYAQVNAAPVGGLIVSGFVGIGTTSPGYSLDMANSAGVINAQALYPSTTLIDNQLISLAEGNDQGGFGGGAVGLNRTMSANTSRVFDLGANINSNSFGFSGVAFDGRFIYFVPSNNGGDFGQITRYDTLAGSFTGNLSYAVFDTAAQVNSNSRGFSGAVFDGRYVYFVPNGTSSSYGQITRYDTTQSFLNPANYTVFNTAISGVSSNSNCFSGALFDGLYIYFVPNNNGLSGQITRYNTGSPFANTASYSVFDTAANVNSNSLGFVGGVFDGRYVYFAPFYNGVGHFGQITRYDTTASFLASTSYAVFDTQANVNSNSGGFFGAVFDGRFIYFIPKAPSYGQISRYDTTGSFTTSLSYAVFDTAANVNSNSNSFEGGVFDGRYVYFSPNGNPFSGQITRLDTASSFTATQSYSVFNTASAQVSSRSSGFKGAVFDGRYVYFVPNSFSVVTRIDAYVGPQATAITASWAPNGFAVGAYAVTVSAPTNGLIISGNVGLATASPGYTLDAWGSVSAGRVYSSATSVDNQLLALAEGSDQGGLGGGAVGTNKTLSANTTLFFNTQAYVNSNSAGFGGAVFDGRYVYFVPENYLSGVFSGQITRFDSMLSFTSSTSYAVYDTQANVNSNSFGFEGAVFDERYVYFVPNNNGVLLRYDTTASFFASTSYAAFNTQVQAVSSNSSTFSGGVFDGRYVYFIPNNAGLITRYDTTGSFLAASGFSVFDTGANVNSHSIGFMGGAFDGRYIYFSPSASDVITRYDTTAPFAASTSYVTLTLASSVGRGGAVFDGRYLYFIPYGASGANGTLLRYDTTGSFLLSTSYLSFDTSTNVNSNSRGFIGGLFDGRYIYLVPNSNGVTTRFDTTQNFSASTAYSSLDTQNVNSLSQSFFGAVFDGRYIYFIPNGNTSPFGQVTRIDAYPGPQATAIAASQAPNGFIIGSYAGLIAAPSGGLLVSNQIGIGTASPGYVLDVYGAMSVNRLYASWLLQTNQDVVIAEGNSQGGFGGGLVGGNKSLNATTTVVFNTAANVNSQSLLFWGSVFDGRYIYYVPGSWSDLGLSTPYGLITRYDTTGSFTASTSYAAFDTGNVNSSSRGFAGGVFDGRYVYLVPYSFTSNGATFGQVTRYDTMASFTSTSSYTFFDMTSVSLSSVGFHGAVFDGRYIYYIPFHLADNTPFSTITRYDTTQSFSSIASYTTFNVGGNVNSNALGFFGGVFDGRYVYFIPNGEIVINGVFTRYDTTGGFSASTSYAVFDLVANVNAQAQAFIGGVFDGRYVYLVPHGNSSASGLVVRYDTGASFTSSTSYLTFNSGNSGSVNRKSFVGGVFDGRYVYFIPNGATSPSGGMDGSTPNGQITSYDTTLSFTATTSYSVLNTAVAAISSKSMGFVGGIFDGKYIYLVPNTVAGKPSGQITRFDAYSGSQATVVTASLAPNGFAIGSYAGVDIAPNSASINSLIVSGYVGIGTSCPGYALDVQGTLAALRIYETATLAQNEGITLAEGLSQGGFGGGSVGTNKTMSANTTVFFDTAANVNFNSVGFAGGVFDGRYVYFSPFYNGSGGNSGQITRYDTTLSFTASSSYAVFDTVANVSPSSLGFLGASFDGRYVYFVPSELTTTPSGQITRYDTLAPFTASTSYAIFDTAANVNSVSRGFQGAIFDGRYLYFVPNNNGGFFGQITRYDTASSFLASTSYAVFDTAANVNSRSLGFAGGTFDGRYIYLAPLNNGVDLGQITRYDTTGAFIASTSYAVFDTAANVNSNSRAFYGAIFDGRYVYFVPNSLTSSFGQITRYDTFAGSFTASTSYSVFDTAANVNSNSYSFNGGQFDGRYVYFVPNAGGTSGQITRYDTTASFTLSTSYTVLNTAAINDQSTGFLGCIFDGRYLYLVPNFNLGPFGQITRIDAYPGPQVSAISASQAPNGLSTGSYAGNITATNGNLIVGGSVGIGTASPTSNLTVLGPIATLRVYSTDTLVNDQAMGLAQGNSQGGFGGGSPPVLAVMGSTTAAVFDLQANVNSTSLGFKGGCFDGRYLYLAPFNNGVNFGQITRFDTTMSFSSSTSYGVFDTGANVNSKSLGFAGAVFDGRFVYFVPNATSYGQITRYDTQATFNASTSYAVFNTAANVNSKSNAFWGGVFDGRYVYLIPSGTGNGLVTRYDTTLSFTSSTSYSAFQTAVAAVSSHSYGFIGGGFDGRYVYFVPFTFGQITRYDTTGSFLNASGYSIFDTQANVNSNSTGFSGSVFDGRYLYFIPSGLNNEQITRYDTTFSFTSSLSYAVFNMGANGNTNSFNGGVFDGRYVYFSPFSNTGGVGQSGQVLRYDTLSSFAMSTSYVVFDLRANVNSSSTGFQGALFDGRYVYFIPNQNGVLTRLNAYVGPPSSELSISWATNLVVGSYSGNFSAPLDSVIIGGALAIGTTSVTANVSVIGNFNALSVYTSATSLNNQLITLAEGYSQGGFGGGLVGTLKTMSSNTALFFDTQANVNSNSAGFRGSVFDGRYLYLVPNNNNGSDFGQITRYDTMAGSFTGSASYVTWDTQANVNSNSGGYFGGVYDGRYLYLVPNSVRSVGQILQYDTTQSFAASTSYAVFDSAANLNSNSRGFAGAVFDGRYVYFVPNQSGALGLITQYDTTESFAASTSYAVFDTAANVNSNSRGFIGGTFDGIYVYLAPSNNGADFGQITSYNTGSPFSSSLSYAVFDTASNVNSNSRGFFGAIFDGRYIYFIPNGTSSSYGQITRYDTFAGSFTASTSYVVFDTAANISSISASFSGGVFDGKYIYLSPNRAEGAGQITRYDTSGQFNANTSYAVLGSQAINSNSYGFAGAAFDGRYVYFIPNILGQVTRIDGYPGPQTSVIGVSQAANGFVVGNLSGVLAAPTGGLLVSGLVGIGTSTPAYGLDVTGIINASAVYTSATTLNNQNISLAAGTNQGGLGGGSMGVVKTLGTFGTIVTFNTTANVNSNSHGFNGSVFDGRFIYLTPFNNTADFGQITRYDTLAGSFSGSASYSVFDTASNVNSNSRGFSGGIYDGRYVYFVPSGTSSSYGQITRYDTTASFTVSTSYAIFDTASQVNSSGGRFIGAVFDGLNVYFVPGTSGIGIVVRYNTALPFSASTSYAQFQIPKNLNSSSIGFSGGTFDGRYVYFSPNRQVTLGDGGIIIRYDSSLSFTVSTSYSVFDTAANVNSNSRGFYGAVFDGRYVYFVPNGTNSSQGQVTRYDTTGSFTTSTSYAVFDTAANVNSNSTVFFGGSYDGRYLYLAPSNLGGSGQITRYDTTASFTTSISYFVFNTGLAATSSNSRGFVGSLFDGRYVYFIPYGQNTLGQITRIDAYTNPQATVIAASQAPNGFVIGSASGTAVTTSSGLIATSGVVLNRVATTGNYIVLSSDTIIGVTSVPRVVTLQSPIPPRGFIVIVMDESGGATAGNEISIVAGGSSLVNGAASIAISTSYGVRRLISNGTNWFTW